MSPLLANWILYMVVAVTVMVIAFVWAVRSGQFGDQDRARYIPLADATIQPSPDREHMQRERVSIWAIAFVVFGAALLAWMVHLAAE